MEPDAGGSKAEMPVPGLKPIPTLPQNIGCRPQAAGDRPITVDQMPRLFFILMHVSGLCVNVHAIIRGHASLCACGAHVAHVCRGCSGVRVLAHAQWGKDSFDAVGTLFNLVH